MLHIKEDFKNIAYEQQTKYWSKTRNHLLVKKCNTDIEQGEEYNKIENDTYDNNW